MQTDAAEKMPRERRPAIPAVNSVQIHEDFVSLAVEWHGGADTMLYAICSSHGLRLGTSRPAHVRNDQHWYWSLWDRLVNELKVCTNWCIVNERMPEAEDLSRLTRFLVFASKTERRLYYAYHIKQLSEERDGAD